MQSVVNPCYAALSSQVKHRNDEQTDPHVDIYGAFYSLWLKYTLADSKRQEIRHQLATLEHETREFVVKRDFEEAVVHFTSLLRALQPYSSDATASEKLTPFTNLSRTIYDQRQRLAHQAEEAAVLKSELQARTETNLALQLQLAASHEQLESVAAQLEQALARGRSLEAENQQLVGLLLAEKTRVAHALNEANARHGEGDLGYSTQTGPRRFINS